MNQRGTNPKRYAWKHLATGEVVQTRIRASKADLFHDAGFGAVATGEPVKGYLAVEVVRREGRWEESPAAAPAGREATR